MAKHRMLVAIPRGGVRDSFVPPALVRRLEEDWEVRFNPLDRQYSPEELARELKDADICLTGWGNVCLTEEVLAQAPNLRIIAHTGGTVATLVNEAAYRRGIRVLSGNELYAQSVAEGVLAYMLASLREIPKYAAQVQNQGWSSAGWYNEGLLGQRVGLVGFGAVAKNTAKMLRAFDVELLVYCPFTTQEQLEPYGARWAPLEEIFSTCKVISLHQARTPETFHQINRSLLDHMQNGALLVNTARGAVVDEAALAEVLQTGRIKAVLDVYEQEPLPMDSPLRGLPNAILIPHMGGPTIDRRPRVTEALLHECQRLMDGEADSWLEISQAAMQRMTR